MKKIIKLTILSLVFLFPTPSFSEVFYLSSPIFSGGWCHIRFYRVDTDTLTVEHVGTDSYIHVNKDWCLTKGAVNPYEGNN